MLKHNSVTHYLIMFRNGINYHPRGVLYHKQLRGWHIQVNVVGMLRLLCLQSILLPCWLIDAYSQYI